MASILDVLKKNYRKNQYSRPNYHLAHGINETREKNVDHVC